MNGNQKLFVEEWLRSQDRISALKAGGYQTDKRTSAMMCFRRLMEREDVKAAIDEQHILENPGTQDEIDKAIGICWKKIGEGGREASTFMGHLLKLKGWDKSTKDTGDTEPPTFANMPFAPTEEPKQ